LILLTIIVFVHECGAFSGDVPNCHGSDPWSSTNQIVINRGVVYVVLIICHGGELASELAHKLCYCTLYMDRGVTNLAQRPWCLFILRTIHTLITAPPRPLPWSRPCSTSFVVFDGGRNYD